MSAVRLICRGDDAGSAVTANRAIREAFDHGLLRNTSVMAPAPCLADAAERLAGLEGLCVGLHATVTAEWDAVRWGPVRSPAEVRSLVRPDGTFAQTTRELQALRPQVDEVLAELDAQLDRLTAHGFDIRYADCHMNFLWTADGLEQAFGAWCDQHGLVNRVAAGRLPKVEGPIDPVDRFLAQLDTLEPGQYLVVGHPGYDTPELRRFGHDGYPPERVAAERDGERRRLVDPRVLALVAERGIVSVRYDEAAEE